MCLGVWGIVRGLGMVGWETEDGRLMGVGLVEKAGARRRGVWCWCWGCV